MSTFGVATKAIIKNKDGKYLVLMKSSKEDINPNTYDIPGGRMSFGEKPEESITREVFEETGLKIKPLKVFEAWTFTKDDFQLFGVNYLCELTEGEVRLSEEHDNFGWYSYDEIMHKNNFPDWLISTIKKAESLS
jgi:8-oxo-dGTP diphosphatase